MASTYSPSLRIELIGAGEQAGTWNSTTNTNLGTIIEDSIAGNVTVSVTGANQALTAFPGAVDEARQAILTLTTAGLVPFAIYAPPQSKQYIIYNNTAYTATIYNSTVLGNTTAAGAGAVIPAGKRLVVFSDAVNFYAADVSNLTGAITSVGNVTSLGSFTSAQLATALTNETGSGSAVFATSPTLVTPALGTPSALVGTNITGTAAGLTAGNATNAVTAANAVQITNAGGWSVTPTGTTLFFSYNSVNVAKLDSSGNLTVAANVTAFGTV
jgi:hypothetical protein